MIGVSLVGDDYIQRLTLLLYVRYSSSQSFSIFFSSKGMNLRPIMMKRIKRGIKQTGFPSRSEIPKSSIVKPR
jgi:hypothetical protein